jgi:hypothetical protein
VALTLLFISGAVLTLITLQLLTPYLPKQPNFEGRNIPTSAGITLVPIILLTLLTVGGFIEAGEGGVAYLIYSFVAVAVGFADDLWGGAGARGFKGHLGALGRGRVTTGMVKVLVLGVGALVVGVVLWRFGPVALVAGVILAGSANLANLLDVRPGRTIKFLGVFVLVLLFVAPYGAVLAVMGVLGGAVALFYFDLKGRIMLGDAGAAVFGVVPGYLVVVDGPGVVWWIAVAVILGLTALAEVSSISRWIEEVGALRWFDDWGRGR